MKTYIYFSELLFEVENITYFPENTYRISKLPLYYKYNNTSFEETYKRSFIPLFNERNYDPKDILYEIKDLII